MQSVSLDCHQHIIDIQDLSFSYGEQKVISNLNYSVRERDFLGIIGSNGAGKTTLMKMIVGLLPASSGEIKLFGTPVRKFKDWERIGYVPQKNAFNLRLSIVNVRMHLKSCGYKILRRKE